MFFTFKGGFRLMAPIKKALLMHPKDQVAVVLSDVKKADGVAIIWENQTVETIDALTDIPQYHKLALRPIRQADRVYKYGEVIAQATAAIDKGCHVHIHNIESVRVRP
jgi:altronate dehydratase